MNAVFGGDRSYVCYACVGAAAAYRGGLPLLVSKLAARLARVG
jgi:hypothetical protein